MREKYTPMVIIFNNRNDTIERVNKRSILAITIYHFPRYWVSLTNEQMKRKTLAIGDEAKLPSYWLFLPSYP